MVMLIPVLSPQLGFASGGNGLEEAHNEFTR